MLASWPPRARRVGPSVQGGPGAPGVNAGPRPWTEGHGGQAQAELMGARPVGWPRGVREVEAGGGVWSSVGEWRLGCRWEAVGWILRA